MTPTLGTITRELSACRPLRDFTNVELSDDLFEDLNLDSLDRVTVALAMEEEFGIDLPDHVIAKWFTVGDIVRCVEGMVPDTQPSRLQGLG